MSQHGRSSRVTQAKVLAATAELMAVGGYRSTGLADVAESLGVSRQAIYHHFPDKPAILTAIFHSLFDQLVESADRIAETEPAGMRFRALMSSHLRIVLRDRPRAVVAIEAHRALPASERTPVERIRAHYLATLQAAYADGAAAGSLRDLPPTFAVRLSLGTANWAARWYRPEGSISPDSMRADLLRFIFHGCETSTPLDGFGESVRLRSNITVPHDGADAPRPVKTRPR